MEETYQPLSPEEVVRLYFTSWDQKNYADMHSTFSDGFKRIEPTAEDLATFRAYVDGQGVEEVNILSLRETSNDETTATVDYQIEFILADGKRVPYQGTFTLKYRTGDIIRGWKLIHPYGENIDNS